MGTLLDAVLLLKTPLGSAARALLGEDPSPAEGILSPEALPSGSLALDLALGIGGLPRGRLIEVTGPPGEGKTSLSLAAIAAVQRRGGAAAFLDAECTLDARWARRLGVDPKMLLVARPRSGEQAFAIIEELLASRAVDLVVVDSLAALVPEGELTLGLAAPEPLHVKLVGYSLRHLFTRQSNKATRRGDTGAALLFIDQLRERPGLPTEHHELPASGDALRFYASMCLEVRRSRFGPPADEGVRLSVRVRKNKFAATPAEAELELCVDGGLSRARELLSLGRTAGLVEEQPSGLWGLGERFGRDEEEAVATLRAHVRLCERLEHAVRVALAGGGAGVAAVQRGKPRR